MDVHQPRIAQLDTQTMTFTNYTKEDGLPNNQFYWNASYYSPQNNLLYFGTINGLVAFTPDIAKTKKAGCQSQTDLNQCRRYHGLSSSRRKNSLRGNKFTYHPSARKDHGFSIEFSTLNYGNCNRVKYAYRLKNYENEWTETLPGEHTARYNFVPSGKYVFQVRATDEKGHWSDKITEVKVTITPYFYKSWWFYLLLAILITVGSYYFYQLENKSVPSTEKTTGKRK